MRLVSSSLLVAGLVLLAASCQKHHTCDRAEAPGSEPAVPKGFVSLFNGIDLEGWTVRDPQNHDWQVVDGVIDCDPREGPGDRNLWTAGSYGDFELLVDWRIKQSPYINRSAKIILPDGTYKKDDAGEDVLIEAPNTDSGVFLRGQHKSQVNIWCWPVGSGEVWGYRTDPAFSPEVHAGVTPKVRADRPIGQWNTFHIVMKGDRLTVRLNGQLVIDSAQLPGVPARGPIALQHHGARQDGQWGASFLQFRRIFIRELDKPLGPVGTTLERSAQSDAGPCHIPWTPRSSLGHTARGRGFRGEVTLPYS